MILFIYFYRDRKGGKKRRRQTATIERYIDQLPLKCPQPATWLATQACALMGNRTSNLLVHRPVLNPLSHTSQDQLVIFTKEDWQNQQAAGASGSNKALQLCRACLRAFGDTCKEPTHGKSAFTVQSN